MVSVMFEQDLSIVVHVESKRCGMVEVPAFLFICIDMLLITIRENDVWS